MILASDLVLLNRVGLGSLNTFLLNIKMKLIIGEPVHQAHNPVGPSNKKQSTSFEIFREKVILLHSHHSCWPCLYKRMDQSISIVIWFDWFCRPVLCRWVIQAVGGFYSNHLLLLDLRARCLSMTMTWLSLRLIWLYGIWFDSKESTSQNPKSSKSSSGIPRMYEVTFDGVGCFMITNFTSFDIIRAPNVPTTSFQRSWDCTLMRDRHPIWFITVRPYTTTLIITCSNDLDLTAALKKEVNCSIWWRPSFVIIEVYWLHSAQNVICTAPDLRTSRKL